MAAKRKSPIMNAKVGNYNAPIDSSGMDPEMKETLGGSGYVPPQGLLGKLMSAFAKKPKAKK